MKKNYILKIALLCTFCVLFSCEKEKEKPKTSSNHRIAGVVLSFDDTYANEWYATDQKLKKYDWKGTFFVSKINTLKHYQIQKLFKLQKGGHEIAGHGLNHYNAADFLRVNTIDEYLHQEINPMLDLMQFYGFKVSSFAYPYGGSN
jgi:peptidoglycan-N-acetylglucosamine deacetylase